MTRSDAALLALLAACRPGAPDPGTGASPPVTALATGDTATTGFPPHSGHTADTGSTDTGTACLPGPNRTILGELDLDLDPWATVTGGAGTLFGWAVAGLGDITGDGLDDLAAQTLSEAIGEDIGGVYLLPSPLPSGTTGARDSGVRLLDATPGTRSDYWVGSGHGTMVPLSDLDGDGLPETALSAQGRLNWPLPGQGIVYLLASSVTVPPGGTHPLDPSYGRIAGADVSDFGRSIAAGDVDADGFEDLLVGAPDGSQSRGSVYVFRGPLAAGDLTEDGASFRIRGDEPLPPQGGSVELATQIVIGDSTGDGIADVVATDSLATANGVQGGEAYAFQGPMTETTTSAADATLQGEVVSDYLGAIGSWLGDTDADGYGEFGLGSTGGLTGPGHAYLFNGAITGVSLASARADTHLYGLAPDDEAAYVFSAGDLDQDGFDDVAVAAMAVNGDARGAVFVYYGPVARGAFPVDAVADATIWGAGGGDWPIAVAAAGDIDDDCMPDLTIGAAHGDAVYVLRGGTF